MNVLFDIISYYRSFDVVMSPKATIFYKSLFILEIYPTDSKESILFNFLSDIRI